MAQLKTTRRGMIAATAALPFAAQAQPKRGGTLVMTIIPEPPSMVAAFNTAAPLTVISAKMLEGLVTYDRDLNPLPHLATAWTIAADGLSISFKLRAGVKWHDGKEFTSADVAHSFELLKKLHPRGRSTFGALTGVETPDPLTAVLKLSRPTPAIMSALSGSESPMLPKHVYETGDPLTNPANNAPIGTGPFKFKEWKRGNFIELVRNPDYWDAGKPYLDRVIVKTYGDATARSAAFETGDLQLASTTPVPLADIERFRKNPAFIVTDKGDELNNSMDIMGFNMRKPQLAKVEVRHALKQAINRDLMIRTVWYGLAMPTDSIVPAVVPAFHNPNLPKHSFNLAAANKALDEAGFPRGADNMRFKLTLDLPTISDVYQREAEFIRQSFRQVGVDVELRISDVPSYLKRVFGEYDFDLCLLPSSATNDPTIGLQRYYWSKAAVKGVPLVNAWGYASADMDAALEGAAVEVDPAKRKALLMRFQEIAMRDLPMMPLAMPLNIAVASAKLHDFMPGGEGIRDPLANAWLE